MGDKGWLHKATPMTKDTDFYGMESRFLSLVCAMMCGTITLASCEQVIVWGINNLEKPKPDLKQFLSSRPETK